MLPRTDGLGREILEFGRAGCPRDEGEGWLTPEPGWYRGKEIPVPEVWGWESPSRER
jgi:hypothetical protein